jgi:hypothetical protein
MALSIFLIHLFGDVWSPEIVGRLADHLGNDLRSGREIKRTPSINTIVRLLLITYER